MRYNPDSMEDTSCPPAGRYHWICTGATEKEGKQYPYVALTLMVDVGRPERIKVFDMLSQHPKALYHLKSFCDATGIDFASGELTERDCIGKEGWANFEPEPDFKDPKRNYLKPKEFIADEMEPSGRPAPQKPANNGSEDGAADDLPF